MGLRFDGISFFNEFNIHYMTESPKVSPGWVGLKCPRHNGTENDTLGFNIRAGFFSCWACGSMHPIEFIELSLGVSNSDAKKLYVQYVGAGDNIVFQKTRVVASGKYIDLPSAPFTPLERNYLTARNLLNSAVKYDLRGGGFDGDFAYRIIFPITMNGCIISATGRRILDETPMKYYTLPPEKELFFHKHTLYNLDNASGSVVAVVEGPIDACRGGDGFVATCGVKPTEEQILLLSIFDEVVFVKDNDSAGEQANASAERVAALGTKVCTVSLDKGQHDVGAMSDAEIQDLRSFIGM